MIPITKTGSINIISELKLPKKRLRLKSKLKNTTVDIYLGTWCGDSKKWVPQFIKLWDELGLKRSQLRLIGLYNDETRYKTAPNGEEQGTTNSPCARVYF